MNRAAPRSYSKAGGAVGVGRAPDGTSHRCSLPAAYAFWQWFAGDQLLCGDGPPLIVDARTGEGQYCFSPESDIDVLAASPTAMKLLANHRGLVAVADATNVA
ncbi:hypothetical protein [Nannocystis exedens]|uniref:hypothetical protein n=1 Tax=Nannocystis exedens TaxID=54 RepID=UPI000BBA0930|nr:hypothetical protein [Nannocystis exedens]PCC74943.1 hypothetical protein NAEX_08043 [Nannocystis exedens]